MLRIIGAVLAGYLVVGVLIFATDQLFAVLIPDIKTAPPDYYFAAAVATDTAYSIAGGYVCALIARARARAATIGLVIFGELAGVASTFYLWNTVPHWYSFGLLIFYPIAIWAGSRMRQS